MTARLYAALAGGLVIVVLVLALLSTRATLATVKAERDSAIVRLDVSNASISTLNAALDRALADQQALASGDADRMKASKEALAVAEAASQWREAARDRLLASAQELRAEPSEECTVSDAVKAVWQ